MEITLYGSIAWKHPLGMGYVLDLAVAHGWDSVDARGMSLDAPGPIEARLSAFGYDMLGPRYIRPSARRALRRRLEESGKRLLGIYCSSSANLPGAYGDACRALLAEYFELAADLGASWVRPINNSTSNPYGERMSPEEAYSRTVEGLRQVAPRANDLGIGLLLENNENTVIPDAAALVRMQDDLSGACRVGIAYDPANAYFQGLDPAEGFSLLAGRIDILHLKNARRHGDRRWDYVPRGDFSYEWTSLAEGDLNWAQLLAAARDARFDGPLVYEYVNPFKGMPPSYWDQLPEPEEAAQREAEFLRRTLRQLDARSVRDRPAG